jgi:coproporphyrinogen III oxidase
VVREWRPKHPREQIPDGLVLTRYIKYSRSGELSRAWFAEGLDLTPLPSREPTSVSLSDPAAYNRQRPGAPLQLVLVALGEHAS